MSATLTKAKRLVAAEERQAREARVERKANELKRETAFARIAADRERKRQAADRAVMEQLRDHAPVTTLTYGELTITVRHIGKDGLEKQTLLEALRRAESIIGQAFQQRCGAVRASIEAGRPTALATDYNALAARLEEDLRFGIRLGAVTIEVTR